jgi:hypothetical protein
VLIKPQQSANLMGVRLVEDDEMIGQSLKRALAGAGVQNVIVRTIAAKRGMAVRKLSPANTMAGPVLTLPLIASCPG